MWPTDKSISLIARKSFRDAEPKYKEHLGAIEKKLSYAVTLEVDVPAFAADDAKTPAAKKEDLGKWLWDLYPQALFKAIGDFVGNGPDEAKKFKEAVTAKVIVIRQGPSGGSKHKFSVEDGKFICQVEAANLGFELTKIDDLAIDEALSGKAAAPAAAAKGGPSVVEQKSGGHVREPASTAGPAAAASSSEVGDQLKQLKLLELRGRIAGDDFDGEGVMLLGNGPSVYSQLVQLQTAASPGALLLTRVSSLLRALAKEAIRHSPTIHAQAATLYGMDGGIPEPRDCRKLSKYLYTRVLRESTPQNPQSFWQVFVPETVFAALRGGTITAEMEQLGFRIKIQTPLRRQQNDNEMIPFTLSW